MMVEELVNAMVRYDADLVVCGMNQIYISENRDKCKKIECLFEREGRYNSLFFIANMRFDDVAINNNCEALWNKLFKKSLFSDELSFLTQV